MAAPDPPQIHAPTSTARFLDGNAPAVRARQALRGALGDAAIGPLQEPGLDGWKWLPHVLTRVHADLAQKSLKVLLHARLKTTKATRRNRVFGKRRQ